MHHNLFFFHLQTLFSMPDDMSKPLIRVRGRVGGSKPLEASLSETGSPLIGIMGTGDFSRSLARRLVASGYQVVVGSRSPIRSVGLFPEEAEVIIAALFCLSHTVGLSTFVSLPCGDNSMFRRISSA